MASSEKVAAGSTGVNPPPGIGTHQGDPEMTKAADNGSGAVGDPTPMTAPEAASFAIISESELVMPILDDMLSAEAKIDSLKISITQLRDLVAQPGKLNRYMQYFFTTTIETTLDSVPATTAAQFQLVTDELVHLKSLMASFLSLIHI